MLFVTALTFLAKLNRMEQRPWELGSPKECSEIISELGYEEGGIKRKSCYLNH
jgi:hypothetical protein